LHAGAATRRVLGSWSDTTVRQRRVRVTPPSRFVPATATTKKLFWCSIDSGHIEQNMPVRDVASGDPENSASWWSNGGRSRASEAEQTVSASYATSKLAQADDAQTGPITRYPAPSIGGAGQQCPTRAEGAATDGYRNRTTRSARHHQLRSVRR